MILDKTCIVFWSNPWTNIIYGFCVVCIVVIVVILLYFVYQSYSLCDIYVGSERVKGRLKNIFNLWIVFLFIKLKLSKFLFSQGWIRLGCDKKILVYNSALINFWDKISHVVRWLNYRKILYPWDKYFVNTHLKWNLSR